jgi:hypothetical protein
MIGWQELLDDVDMVHDAKFATRLESYRLEISMPSRKSLQSLAWAAVNEGFRVELHTPDTMTILGTGDERIMAVRVRADG